MNTIHRPTLEAAQRLYETRLAEKQHQIATLAQKCPVGDWPTAWDTPRERINGNPSHETPQEGSGQRAEPETAFNGHREDQAEFSLVILALMLAGWLALAVVAMFAWERWVR